MIKSIHYHETYEIRHEVMWPEESIDYIKLSGDKNAKHYGYFDQGKLVAVLSVFSDNNQHQLRKIACLEEYQNKGYASQLIKHALANLSGLIWLNARYEKIYFYKKFNFKPTQECFEKKGQKYIVMAINKTCD